MKTGEELRARGRERTNRWRARRRAESEWVFKRANNEYQRSWRATKVVGDVKNGTIIGRDSEIKRTADGATEGAGTQTECGASDVTGGADTSRDSVRECGRGGAGDKQAAEGSGELHYVPIEEVELDKRDREMYAAREAFRRRKKGVALPKKEEVAKKVVVQTFAEKAVAEWLKKKVGVVVPGFGADD
jgi:hypothetical protein